MCWTEGVLGMGTTIRRALAASALGLSLAWLAPATVSAQQLDFSIPAQPLNTGLAALARQSGVQISADSAVVSTITGAPVDGEMSVEAALDRLLGGAGLSWRRTGETSFIVENVVPAPSQQDVALTVDKIVVLGERVERTVFETASSVVVIDGDTVQANPQYNDLEAVFGTIPNIVTSTGNNGAQIRGVSSSGALSGGALGTLTGNFPRTTVTIDGRNQSSNETIYGTTSIFDTEAIEVFRGPQTTSQGANAIGGAINLRTRDPVFDFEAAARAELATRDGRAASVMVNAPLFDSAALRFVYDYEQQHNYFDFVAAPGSGVIIEDVATRVQQDSARLKLLIEPVEIPQLSTKFTLMLSEFSAPQNQTLTPPFGSLQFQLDAGQGINTFKGETTAMVHDFEYDFENGFSFRNQIQVSRATTTGTSAPGSADDLVTEETDKSLEAIISYDPEDGPFSAFFAGYLRDITTNTEPNNVVILEGDRSGRALFGEFTYEFGNGFDVTAGLRYQENEQSRFAAQILGPGFVFPLLNYEASFDALLPKLALGYDLSEETRLAVQVARGYNPGGGAIVLTTLEPYIFDQEQVTNVELSLRHRSADERLFVDANLFYNRYSDFQFFVSRIVPPAPPFFQVQAGRVVNLDKVTTYGFELSAGYEVLDDLDVSGSLGLLQTSVGEAGPQVAALTDTTNIDGNNLPLAPNVTFSIGAGYQATEDLSVGGQLSYTSNYFSGIDNDPTTKVGDYIELDLTAAYQITDIVEVYGYVNNVFNELGPISVFRDPESGLVTSGSVLEPREFGIGLRAVF